MTRQISTTEGFTAGCLVLSIALFLVILIAGIVHLFEGETVVSEETRQAIANIPTDPDPIKSAFLAKIAEGAKAAEDFEDAIMSTVPLARSHVDYIDIDGDDGHLMIFAHRMQYLDEQTTRPRVYATILNRWRRTEWAQKHPHGRWAEILVSDPASGEMKTMREIR
jgi:hypothetical protein